MEGGEGRELGRDVADLVPLEESVLQGELRDSIKRITGIFQGLVFQNVLEPVSASNQMLASIWAGWETDKHTSPVGCARV